MKNKESRAFPGGSSGKESTCNAGDLGSIPGVERSLGGEDGSPVQYCLEFHGQWSLVGQWSLWGRRELDTTEWLSTAQGEMNLKENENFESFACHFEEARLYYMA